MLSKYKCENSKKLLPSFTAMEDHQKLLASYGDKPFQGPGYEARKKQFNQEIPEGVVSVPAYAMNPAIIGTMVICFYIKETYGWLKHKYAQTKRNARPTQNSQAQTL